MKNDVLQIGMAGTSSVSIFREDLANGMLMTVGKSGYGKTNALKGLIHQKAREQTVIVPDTSESFDEIERLSDITVRTIDVYCDGLGIKPLQPMRFDNIHVEKTVDVATRFTDTMTNIYKLGTTQSSFLYQALKRSIPDMCDMNEQLRSCYQVLSEQEGESVAKLCSKLEYLADLQIFSQRDDFDFKQFFGGGVILIKMKHFPMQVKRLILELMLWEIWRLFQENKSKGREVTLVLDECQTLDFSDSSPITKILTEGRKFGINCWLATQFIKGNFNEAVINRLEQADTKLYFRPTDGDIKYIAPKLDSRNRKEWTNVLQQLQIGEAILLSTYRLMERKHREPIIVSTQLEP